MSCMLTPCPEVLDQDLVLDPIQIPEQVFLKKIMKLGLKWLDTGLY